MSNSNCLEGMACPECDYDKRFDITAITVATITDEGSDDHGDLEYDDTARCVCCGCGHVSTVGVFRGEAPKLVFAEERMAVVSTGHVTEDENLAIPRLIRNGTIKGMARRHGWLIHVHSSDGDLASLNTVLTAARQSGFQWVLLDCDGDLVEGLPAYDW